MPDRLRQEAPYPTALLDLVKNLRYKPGWTAWLADDYDRGQGSVGLTLIIQITAPDTNDPAKTVHVAHFMLVPAASYTSDSWRNWLFEQILLVEKHEAMEFFWIGAQQPFAPNHGQGEDPYRLVQVTTQAERSKTFRD